MKIGVADVSGGLRGIYAAVYSIMYGSWHSVWFRNRCVGRNANPASYAAGQPRLRRSHPFNLRRSIFGKPGPVLPTWFWCWSTPKAPPPIIVPYRRLICFTRNIRSIRMCWTFWKASRSLFTVGMPFYTQKVICTVLPLFASSFIHSKYSVNLYIISAASELCCSSKILCFTLTVGMLYAVQGIFPPWE